LKLFVLAELLAGLVFALTSEIEMQKYYNCQSPPNQILMLRLNGLTDSVFVLGKTKKNPLAKANGFSINDRRLKLSRDFFLNDNLSFEVQFTVQPVSSVWQVHFTCSLAFSQSWGFQLVVSSSFISSGFRNFSFRMCHFMRGF
jgi:hypothetical protein